MPEPIITGFDPLFGGPLRKLMDRARAEGYNPSIISGVRDDKQQGELVANAAATRAGQPLPYPQRGPVQKAAPVGYSPHEYGAASDVSGIPQGELARLAQQVGLNTISGDPGHVELGGWQNVASNQPSPTPWDATNPANVPSRYASNVDATAPMVSAYASQIGATPPDRLASMVGTLESGGGRYSSAQPKSMVDPLYGQYPGFANTYGRGAAGINNYAQAVLSANPKASVGDFYAGYFSGTGTPGSPNFNNFDLLSKGAIQSTPGTSAAQKAAAMNFVNHAGIDPSTPLATVVAPAAPAGPGAINQLGQPTGQPATPAAVASAAPTAAPQTWGDRIKAAITRPTAKDAQGNDVQGKSPLENALGAFKPPPPPPAAADTQQAPMMPMQDPTAQMMGPSQQLLTAAIAAGAKPLSWSARPFGYQAGQQMGDFNG